MTVNGAEFSVKVRPDYVLCYDVHEVMNMPEKTISTGEAAKISGLSIRTLQHYDNIGILPASGRTEGGRRYYTENDMIKLEHIVFYRGLGFSLEQIKDKLLGLDAEKDMYGFLSTQKTILYNQIERIQNSIAAIDASIEITETGKTPPWKLLAAFMQSMGDTDLSSWQRYEFTDEQKEVFNAYLPSLDDVLEFYDTWKRLSIKAASYQEAGISASSPIAQKLALDWIAMEQKVTGGNEEHAAAYLQVDQSRNAWSLAEKELMDKAEPYLDAAIRIYKDK